jgi:hypothetical protein
MPRHRAVDDPHAFEWRPGIDPDKLNQVADDLAFSDR